MTPSSQASCASLALLNFKVENKESLSRTFSEKVNKSMETSKRQFNLYPCYLVDKSFCGGIHPLSILWHENIVFPLHHLDSNKVVTLDIYHWSFQFPGKYYGIVGIFFYLGPK